jgi:energy-coupling factor transporter transmembrane protein EcfT
MTNAPPWDKWFHHFSFDEFCRSTIAVIIPNYSLHPTDILPITLAFFSLEFFTTMVACIFALLLNSRKMLHATYKLFLHALGVDLICMLLIWMHYDRYSENGRGFPLFKLIALMLRCGGFAGVCI